MEENLELADPQGYEPVMSELELLDLARSTTQNQVAWFAQVITINFGMVVGIYYFLNRAKIALKLFAFIAYSVGMLVLLGEMLVEANVKTGAIEGLKALAPDKLSRPTVLYLAVNDSFVSLIIHITFNLSFWVLWFGILYLLFFWKEGPRPDKGSDS
jgi:hypothetical protein